MASCCWPPSRPGAPPPAQRSVERSASPPPAAFGSALRLAAQRSPAPRIPETDQTVQIVINRARSNRPSAAAGRSYAVRCSTGPVGGRPRGGRRGLRRFLVGLAGWKEVESLGGMIRAGECWDRGWDDGRTAGLGITSLVCLPGEGAVG